MINDHHIGSLVVLKDVSLLCPLNAKEDITVQSNEENVNLQPTDSIICCATRFVTNPVMHRWKEKGDKEVKACGILNAGQTIAVRLK